MVELPEDAVGLKLFKIDRKDELIACEGVMFARGRAAVDTVLRRAAISGRVEIGGKINDHFADVLDERAALEARALAAEKQLKPLLRVAKIAEWMVKDIDAEEVAEHARNFPGSTGPRVGQTAAKTRDLMAALKAAAAIRANDTP